MGCLVYCEGRGDDSMFYYTIVLVLLVRCMRAWVGCLLCMVHIDHSVVCENDYGM